MSNEKSPRRTLCPPGNILTSLDLAKLTKQLWAHSPNEVLICAGCWSENTSQSPKCLSEGDATVTALVAEVEGEEAAVAADASEIEVSLSFNSKGLNLKEILLYWPLWARYHLLMVTNLIILGATLNIFHGLIPESLCFRGINPIHGRGTIFPSCSKILVT